MRSASDRSPRSCTTKPHHQRSTDDDHDERPAAAAQSAGVPQWRAGGERATLPRAARDAERTAAPGDVPRSARDAQRTAAATPGDVWRPMNDVGRAGQKDVVVKGL